MKGNSSSSPKFVNVDICSCLCWFTTTGRLRIACSPIWIVNCVYVWTRKVVCCLQISVFVIILTNTTIFMFTQTSALWFPKLQRRYERDFGFCKILPLADMHKLCSQRTSYPYKPKFLIPNPDMTLFPPIIQYEAMIQRPPPRYDIK